MILKGGKGSCTALHVKGCSSLKVEVSFMTREASQIESWVGLGVLQ